MRLRALHHIKVCYELQQVLFQSATSFLKQDATAFFHYKVRQLF